jgi:hypothetical protein
MESISLLQLWTGRTLSGIAIAFLFVDAVGKLMRASPVVEGAVKLGYPEDVVLTLGLLLMIGVVLYAIPKTSLVGAIYLTAFLGGALATHFRVGSPLSPISCSAYMLQHSSGVGLHCEIHGYCPY